MRTLGQDLRFALRMLQNNLGFAAVAVLSLALGIGANTAIFSIFNTVLLRPLPYEDSERLVVVGEVPLREPDQLWGVSVANFLAWKEQNQVFEEIGAGQGWPINITSSANPELLQGQRVSSGFLQALAVKPVLGRLLLPEDYDAGAGPVIVLSHGLWQRRFGGDPEIVGKTLPVEGVDFTIVGVTPADFRPLGYQYFFDDAAFWIPFRFASFNIQSETRYLLVAARLRPGVSIERGQAEMDIIASRLAQAYPDRNRGWGVRLEPMHEWFVGGYRPRLLVLQVAVAFVLLIACANVAGLLLAQVSSRQREISVRSALGASRLRVVRQFLTEAALLALVGGLLGLLLAQWGIGLFAGYSPENLPRFDDVSLDGRVLGFTLLISVLTGLLFAVAPAMQGSKPDLGESLKESGRGATAGAVRQRLRSVLVVAQVAMALVLLIGTGLMINSFVRLARVDTGFDTENLLTFRMKLPKAEYLEDAGAPTGYHMVRPSSKITSVFQQVLEGVENLPGVRTATAANVPPLRGWGWGRVFTIVGRPRPDSNRDLPRARFYTISANFFRTIGVPLLRGRYFTPRDSLEAPWVVIINQAMASRYWPDEDPIGRRLTFEGLGDERPRQVVGIVGNIRLSRLDSEPEPQMYVPHAQQATLTRGASGEGRLQRTFILRTAVEPMSLVPQVRKIAGQLSGNQPIDAVKTVRQYKAELYNEPRFYLLVLGIFGGIAVILAALGVYGVVAYSVNQRTHEIGIRMALGADQGNVLKMVVKQGLVLTSLGVGIGLVAAFWLTRFIAGYLYAIEPTDPLTFVTVSLVLTTVALSASYIPARRATKVEPLVALRHE